MEILLPPEFDPIYYRKIKPYLQFNDEALQQEFELFGKKSGSPGSFFCYRELVVKVFRKIHGSILEIGPGTAPDFIGENVKYLDILSTQELSELYSSVPSKNGGAPDINYQLSELVERNIKEKFNLVYSAHNFEHQVNCVLHLNDISEILNPGGFFVAAIPDKNYTFDYYHPLSTLIDILSAPKLQLKHSIRTLMFSTETSHNNPLMHWLGVHGESKIKQDFIIKTYLNGEGKKFTSRHVNIFEPESFKNIFKPLSEMNAINLNLLRVYNTPFGRNEFIVIFQKEKKQ